MLPAVVPQYNSPFGHWVPTGAGQSLGAGSGHSPFRMRISLFAVVGERGLIGHGAERVGEAAKADLAPHVLQKIAPR